MKPELGSALGSSCVNLWELTNVYALFDRYGAQGYLLMSAMCVIGVAGAVRLYAIRRLDPA